MPMVGGWLGQRMMQFLVCRFLNTVRSCEFQESSSVFMSSRFFSGVIFVSCAPSHASSRTAYRRLGAAYAGTVGKPFPELYCCSSPAGNDRQVMVGHRHTQPERRVGADGRYRKDF